MEFLAEKQLISVVPNFTHAKMFLISGDVGPFRPGLPIQVPLWMGVNLKQRQKCRLLPPEWLEVDKLEELKEEEKNSRLFIKLPDEHFIVVAKVILQVAAADIPRCDEVRTLIKDIWDIRTAKLRTSINAFMSAGKASATLTHLTLIEINSVRPIFSEALTQIHRINKAGSAASGFTQNSSLG